MKNKIFRLEHKPQKGIYVTGNFTRGEEDGKREAIQKAMDKHFGGSANLTSDRHPCPWNDSLLMDSLESNGIDFYDSTMFCGFKDESQFRAWFYSDDLLKDLGDLGCTLVVYEISTIYYGNCQTCGNISELEEKNVICRMSLHDYLEKGLPTFLTSN